MPTKCWNRVCSGSSGKSGVSYLDFSATVTPRRASTIVQRDVECVQIVGCKLQLNANVLMSESSSLSVRSDHQVLELILATDVFRVLFSVREQHAESERCNRYCFELGGWHVMLE
ncbi:hypothetical protein RP20_CCG020221 [Aedes albopictus]|nr:hypothetical protein RP20_CCG020221 [Aedes albopictus]